MKKEISMHPLNRRLLEEEESKNKNYPGGRELCGILAANNKNGPLFFTEDAKAAYENATGWENFGGAKTVYATSFCRADAKEIVQVAAQVKYLEKLGLSPEDQNTVYFIDPYSHTTDELLEVMARDYGLELRFLQELFINPILNTDRDPKQLPVAMQKAPTAEMLSRLNLPEEVMNIMFDALRVTPQTLGDWRIEVDKISAKKLFVALGLDPDLIKIVSFEEIFSNRQNMNNLTITNLATNVKQAHMTYTETIAEYSGRNGVAVLQNPPSMLSIVGINNEKILYSANGELYIIRGGVRFKYADIANELSSQEKTYYKDLQETIWNMSIYDVLKLGGVQLSGFGYYQALGLAIEEDEHSQDAPAAMIILDDYENPDGPVAAVTHTQQKGLYGVSSVKPLVGFNGDFGAAPDLTMLTQLSREDMAVLKGMIEYTSSCMVKHDIITFAGVDITYNEQTKKPSVTSAGVIDRGAIKRLFQIVEPDRMQIHHNPDAPFHPQLSMFAAIWHPTSLEKILNGNLYDLSSLNGKKEALDPLVEFLNTLGHYNLESMSQAIEKIQQELLYIIESRNQEIASSERENELLGSPQEKARIDLHRLEAVIEIYEKNGIELPQELLAEYETIAVEVNLDKDRITILENRIKSMVMEDARRKLETELKQKIDDEFSMDVEDIRFIRLLLSARQSIDGIKNAFNLTSIEDFITSGALLEAIAMIKDPIKTGELNWNRLLQISNNGIKEGGVIKPFAKNQLQSLNALQAYVEYVKNKPPDVEKNSTELNGTNDFCSIIDANIIERLSTMVLINIDKKDELNPKKILAELALVEKEISQRKQQKQAEFLGIDIGTIDPKKIRDCILGRMQSLASNKLNDEYGQDIIQEWNKKNIAVWGEEILKQLIQEKKVQGMCSEKQMLHRSNIESILKISYPDMWNKMVSTIYQNAMLFN